MLRRVDWWMVTDFCQEHNAFLFRVKQSKNIDKPEDIGSTPLRNTGNLLPVSAVQYPRRMGKLHYCCENL